MVGGAADCPGMWTEHVLVLAEAGGHLHKAYMCHAFPSSLCLGYLPPFQIAVPHSVYLKSLLVN